MEQKSPVLGTVKSIDTLLFDETVNTMINAINSFSSARNNIMTATDHLLETWEGDGKNSFERVYKKLKTELKDEEENLTTVKDDLVGIMNTYVEWDTQLKNDWTKKG